jgi:hypothetical protein
VLSRQGPDSGIWPVFELRGILGIGNPVNEAVRKILFAHNGLDGAFYLFIHLLFFLSCVVLMWDRHRMRTGSCG